MDEALEKLYPKWLESTNQWREGIKDEDDVDALIKYWLGMYGLDVEIDEYPPSHHEVFKTLRALKECKDIINTLGDSQAALLDAAQEDEATIREYKDNSWTHDQIHNMILEEEMRPSDTNYTPPQRRSDLYERIIDRITGSRIYTAAIKHNLGG